MCLPLQRDRSELLGAVTVIITDSVNWEVSVCRALPLALCLPYPSKPLSQPCDVGTIIILVLLMWKLGHREVE